MLFRSTWTGLLRAWETSVKVSVTKKDALNRTALGACMAVHQFNGRWLHALRRAAALSRWTCHCPANSNLCAVRRAAARRAREQMQMQRRPGGAVPGFVLAPAGVVGVQPRLDRREGARAGALHKSTARAQRLASGLQAAALDHAGSQWLWSSEKRTDALRAVFMKPNVKGQRAAKQSAAPIS